MKKYIKYLIPSIITIIILLVIYYLEGLYPFSSNSMVQVDADYQFIPVLYKIYDFLHGNTSILYDDIGLGNSIYTSMIIQGSIFSPMSLLLYFTSRSNILYYFNIVVMIKISLISLTSYIYFKYKFKVNEYYLILFSIIYAFSGWVILNYFNIMWLDGVILFPLIMLYLDKLIYDNKYLGYVITLSLCLIISYYISAFILIFIVFYSFINIFLFLDKDRIKRVIFILGISTLISIFISSFSFLPAIYHTLVSSRLSHSGSYPLFGCTQNKVLYFMGMSLPLVLFLKLIGKFKHDSKMIYFYILIIFLYIVGVMLEPINLAMHFGSHWSFPYRYSFIPLFILISSGLYYISKFGIKYGKLKIFPLIVTIIISGLVIYVNHIYFNDIKDSNIILDFDNYDVFIHIVIIFILFISMKLFALNTKNKISIYILLGITTLIEIFIICSWTIYYNSGYYLSLDANNLNSSLDLDGSYLNRYKMDYPYYSLDYGFIVDVNTLDNWLHILPNGMTDTYRSLGYLVNDTSIKSLGGTILTDNLLYMNYIISKEYKEEYDLVMDSDEYKLYKYKNTMPFGIVYDSGNIILNNYDNSFYLHNDIYHKLFNKEDDVVNIVSEYNQINGKLVEFNIDIDEDSYVYIDLSLYGKKVNFIVVNDSSYYYNLDNYIKYLGIYKDKINIKVYMKEDNYVNYMDVGLINCNKYVDFINGIDNGINVNYDNGYHIHLNNEYDNKSLFLPINNIKGIKVYLNGNVVKTSKFLDNFISVDLVKGNNDIKIIYHEPYLVLGIILSILGIILLILFKYININNKCILNITYYSFILLFIFLYIYIYAYSFVKK